MKIFGYKQIPVIDIAAADDSSGSAAFKNLIEELRFVYSKIGFAYLVNHSIPQSLFYNVFRQSKLFFELPEKEKIKIKQNEFFRGYMPLAKSCFKISTLGQTRKPNQSAAFIIAHEANKKSYDYKMGINLAGPNQWPSDKILPDFKKVILDYQSELSLLARKLVRLFSFVLEHNGYSLEKYFKVPTTFLRLQHYPPQSDSAQGNYGIAPHTDYGFLTLLVQDAVGGLQVLRQDGEWIDVPSLSGGVILNTGDMLKCISNNRIISTPHRVINISAHERYSIPFFWEPDMHAIISMPHKNNNFGQKSTFEYAEYLMARIKNNYSIGAKDKNDLLINL